MKKTTLTNHIDALQTEVFTLLRFQLAYNRIIKFDKIKEMSRSDFVDRLISLKAIENDLVIRICKFDDDSKGVHSLKKALYEMPTNHSNRVEIETKIKSFSQLIHKIKMVRRHTQLAHLKIGSVDNEFDICYDLVPAIKLLVYLIDLFSQTKNSYNWSDGRYEKFNLRKEVLDETSNLE